jgi:hypothetical protein
VKDDKLSAIKIGGMWFVNRQQVLDEAESRRKSGKLRYAKKEHRLKVKVSKDILAKLDAIGFDRTIKPGKGRISVLSEDVAKAMAASRRTTKLSGHALSKLAGYSWNYCNRVEQLDRSISDIAVHRFSIVIDAANGNPTPLKRAFKHNVHKNVAKSNGKVAAK